ncbi:helix-turn-helix transcriptional regulator [Wolbachia endosymbiont of Pentalonia nigronervosa]|nr:helix-turn-helix transcriptional regulator [Wolbachia endosymbiont of Pentalonia nigronervosa]
MNIDKLENEELNFIDAIIGKKIRQFRLTRGFTQSELAEKIGISYQQIQKYENGTNHISIKQNVSRLFSYSFYHCISKTTNILTWCCLYADIKIIVLSLVKSFIFCFTFKLVF